MKQRDTSETIFDKDNPTKNLDNLIWKYRALKENIGNSTFDIEKSRSKLIEYLHEHHLYDTSHRAIQEIKKLVNSPNFNSFSNKYLLDAKKITEGIENLNIQYSLSNINNLGLLYHKVITPLSSFINEVSNLLGINTIDNNSIEEKQETKHFDTLIFKDQESYKLFLFMVKEYAVNKSVGQFSQIFYWLRENENRIKNNKGEKYKEFIKRDFKIDGKFARIAEDNRTEQITLNEIFKLFNSNK